MSWVSSNTKIQGGSTAHGGYTRPSDWPVLPTVNQGDQVFRGLYAVWNSDSNFIALSATGGYTVDWGDGSAPENIVSGAQAEHIYDYATVSSAVTGRGYKTVVVTVTPQSGGLNGLNLSKKHSQTGVSNYGSGWLEIAISGVFSPTGLVVSSSSVTITHRRLERVICIYGTAAVTTMNYMFYNCPSLQSVPLFDTAAVTTMASMFSGCSSLQSVPLFDTAAVTSMGYMFYNCPSLQSVLIAPVEVSVSFSGCLLSKNAIVTIFDNLATVAGQTITVSNNWGYAILTTTDREIATSKGWAIA